MYYMQEMNEALAKKPDVVGSRVHVELGKKIPNTRMLLMYSMKAVRDQLLLDQSTRPAAPDWQGIAEYVSMQVSKEFQMPLQVVIVDDETEEVLKYGAGEFEADAVTVEIMLPQLGKQPMQLPIH